MIGFFQGSNEVNSVKDGPIRDTWGYDFHFAYSEHEASKAKELLEVAVQFISNKLPLDHVYIDNHKNFDVPVGPWLSPMWQIQLGTVTSNTKQNDPIASSEGKLQAIYQFMLGVAEFLKNEVASRNLTGFLLIHANTWPDNSNQVLERDLHFNRSWLVCGEKIILKDIWGCPGGLIEMESFIKQELEKNSSDIEIKMAFIDHFKGQNMSEVKLTYYVDVLIEAQQNLKELQRYDDPSKLSIGEW